MLHDTKLVQKSLKNICKLTKINKKNFPPYIISSETFVIDRIGNSHSFLTF